MAMLLLLLPLLLLVMLVMTHVHAGSLLATAANISLRCCCQCSALCHMLGLLHDHCIIAIHQRAILDGYCLSKDARQVCTLMAGSLMINQGCMAGMHSDLECH
jgi:hypothetical protein